MEDKFVFADPNPITGPKNHRGGGARFVDESTVYTTAVGYIEKTLIGSLQHGVIARDAVVVQHDVIRLTTADSKDPISLQREVVHLTIDLDFKVSSGSGAHLV
jgi:hypothetical protein